MKHQAFAATLLIFFTTLFSTDVLAGSCGGTSRDRKISVSKSDAKCKWPFAVDQVELWCAVGDKSIAALVVIAKGRPYALNGTAVTMNRRDKLGWNDFDDIWLPDAPGPRVDIGPWIAATNEACPD